MMVNKWRAQNSITDLNANTDCILNYCEPLDIYDFGESLATSLWIQLGLAVGIRLIALIGMYVISNPKRPKLAQPQKLEISSQ